MGFFIYIVGMLAALSICTLINRSYKLNYPEPIFPLFFAICMFLMSWMGVIVAITILLNHVYAKTIITKYQSYCEGKKWYVKAYNYFSGRDKRNKNVIYVEPVGKDEQNDENSTI